MYNYTVLVMEKVKMSKCDGLFKFLLQVLLTGVSWKCQTVETSGSSGQQRLIYRIHREKREREEI